MGGGRGGGGCIELMVVGVVKSKQRKHFERNLDRRCRNAEEALRSGFGERHTALSVPSASASISELPTRRTDEPTTKIGH